QCRLRGRLPRCGGWRGGRRTDSRWRGRGRRGRGRRGRGRRGRGRRRLLGRRADSHQADGAETGECTRATHADSVLAHFALGCFGTLPRPPAALFSCSTNVVATSSASIVTPVSVFGCVLIEISPTLMIRGNLLIRSKKNPRS